MPPTITITFSKEAYREMPVSGVAARRLSMGGNGSKSSDSKPKKIIRQSQKLEDSPPGLLNEETPSSTNQKRAKSSLLRSTNKRNSETVLKRLEADENLVQSGAEDESEDLDRSSYSVHPSSSTRRLPSISEEENTGKKSEKETKLTKKQYFVKNADGKPTEKYDREYFLKMRYEEDVDDGSGDEGPNSVITVTDRWRAEWEYGVQILLNPEDLPVFSTKHMEGPTLKEKSTFSLPSKYVSTENTCESDKKKLLPRPSVRLYQGDELDCIWLRKFNEAREAKGRSLLVSTVFMDMMNALEITAYKNIHEMLLRPLHSPASRDTNLVDDEASCDICRYRDSEPDDEMVFCDGCNVCVHMSCYGLEDLPQDEWLCMKCQICKDVNPPCVLCPTIGGALKRTKSGNRWAHVVCALWLPECRFENFEKREPITNIEEIADERWQLKCSICDTRQGACIQCTEKSCNTAFHVSCALRSGNEMRIEQYPDPENDGVQMIALCNKHDPKKKEESLLPQAENDERESSDLRRLESFFYLYVDGEKVSDSINLNRAIGAEVYEYWKQKRLRKGGRPLLENPQDNIVIDPGSVTLELPNANFTTKTCPLNRRSESFNSEFHVNKWRAKILRSNLDKDRNIITQLVRRERMKQQLQKTERDAIELLLQMTNSSAVVSQRAVEGFTETIEKFLTEEEKSEALRLFPAPSPKDSLVTNRANRARSSLQSAIFSTPVRKPTKRRNTSNFGEPPAPKRRLTLTPSSKSPQRKRPSVQSRRSLRSNI
ncbi:unnamed protein product [Caenorhabditis auriculariae]|uniref:Uncharacterized protein n=1 Tax=Caenorhabditis auriculariae TaxID=2777116 RepID=A0A8S1GY77_9PELO|nr:unnamed protein product [Caenorhabditis auriculariae]